MSSLDPLMRMIAAQGGTTLRAVAGEQPRLFHGTTPLRFFAPPLAEGLLRDMARGTLDEAAWTAVEAGETGRAEVEVPKTGRFEVEARIEGGRISLVVQRSAVAAEPDPEPPRRRRGAGATAALAKGTAPGQTAGPVVETSVATPAPTETDTDAPPAAHPPAAWAAPAGGVALAAAPLDDLGPLAPLLARAMALGASDLHLGEAEVPVIRVDGRLRVLPGMGVTEGLEADLVDALSAAGRAELARTGAVDFAVDLGAEGRVRGNAYRHSGGLALALRVLQRGAPTLDSLDLGADLRPLAALPHGLVLVCGPTGSGKSTTLAALARLALESRGGVLVTLEDPIEFLHHAPAAGRVRQRAVGIHVPDFASGLRDALREDPDFLLVGEMRDRATIELAITAAETGHLVFSTLHSRTASSAVERIVDGVPAERQAHIRTQLADSLRAIVSQRLMPRADGDGRVVALEVLRVTDAVAAHIREGRTAQIASAIQSGGELGMVALGRSLAARVRRGQVTRADAEAAMGEHAGFGLFLD